MEKSFKQFNRNIEESEEKPFDDKKEKPQTSEKIGAEELEQYQKEGQKIIDSYQKFFITYAKDISLRFKFKIFDGPARINLENGEVELNAKWAKEKDLSQDQILWASLHELSHFRDLAEDPKKMMENFGYIEAKAKQTGAAILKKWEEKYGAIDPEFIEGLGKQNPIDPKNPAKRTMNATEAVAYKIHHLFYNIFDDIYVNNLVSRKAVKFEPKEKGGGEVKNLYKKKLFPASNYSQQPRHLQFLYKLLREEMAPEENTLVSEEVAATMEKKIRFYGKDYTPKEIVDNFIKPKGGRDTLAGQRYFVLQKTLEPIFEELLKKDLEEWEPQKPEKRKDGEGSGGGGSGEGKPQEDEGTVNPFEDDYQEYEKNNPDQISDTDIQDWLGKNEKDKEEKKAKEAEEKKKEKAEDSKSAEQKAKEAQEKMDEKWREKNNISEETLNGFREIEAEVAPYLDDLSRLWQRIIFGSSRQIERGIEGHYKTGSELDIQKTIEEWPKIEKADLDEIKIMKRQVLKEELVRRPELIRVRLVGDMSGSMDEAKRRILQQCFVLLLSSLEEFNACLNLTRQDTKSKLEVDTEAWIFGSEAYKIKNLRRDGIAGDERAEIVRVLEKLQNTIGYTYDNRALQAILKELSPEDKEKIGQEKIMEIVFEITDGGSSNEAAARESVDALRRTEVIARAFQIGAVNEKEKKIFNNVWNKNREEKLGEIVGVKIDGLLPAITEALKKYLGNVRL